MNSIATATTQKDLRQVVEQINGQVVKTYNTDVTDLQARIDVLEAVSLDITKILVDENGDVLTDENGEVLLGE